MPFLTKQGVTYAQEAVAVGLKGQVQAVFTEEFRSTAVAGNESYDSTFDVYDRDGYELEFFRYKPDGAVSVHTVYARKGSQIFRTQVTATAAPFQSYSEQNLFDAQRRLIETDTYDTNGVLVSRFRGDFAEQQPNSSLYRRTETQVDGSETTSETRESTDPQTGITRQIDTKEGKLEADWTIQRNKDGTEQDKIIYADGSYNARERRADGTTVEDRYAATTKEHTYQTSDSHGHPIEIVQGTGPNYLRCTYSFDRDSRPTGQINYDESGRILGKSTIEYRDDSRGNWVERKLIEWDTDSEPMQPKIVVTTLRTINYY